MDADRRTAATVPHGSTTPEGAPLLSVRRMSIHFGGVYALTDASLDVAPGQTSAIIGPNGAGKTTLFNCISGLYRGDGDVTLDGESVQALGPAARAEAGIARTFQTPALVDEDTVLGNVMLGSHRWTRAGMAATFLGLPRVAREEREARAAASDLLERLELADLADAPVAGLPHRQRRLTEIARAFVSRPRVLLLDEPAAGSHHAEARGMLQTVSALAAERDTTLVLVEHNVSLVMEFAAHVTVLDFGKVIAAGAPAEVQRDKAVIDAYLGSEPV